jgi:thymidylate synthase (FAD)
MNERLISIAGGGCIELQDVLGDDLTVVNAARVSFSKQKSELDSSDIRLIKYLAKHNHYTPFAQPHLRFRIRMPIFVARQWYKHSVGLTRNEVSRRYVTSEPEFYLPQYLRMSAENVKQGSSDEEHTFSGVLLNLMRQSYRESLRTYHMLLEDNVCAEQARMILPQAMFTEFIETGSLAAYARIYSLRTEKTAQQEIRDYAIALGQLVEKSFPHSWSALVEEGVNT